LAKFLELPEPPTPGRRVKRPTAKAYKTAVDLVSGLSIDTLPLPRIAPDRQGGIQFEREKGSYALEVGISPNGRCEVLKVTPSREEEGRAPLSEVRESLIWFARQ